MENSVGDELDEMGLEESLCTIGSASSHLMVEQTHGVSRSQIVWSSRHRKASPNEQLPRPAGQ